MNSQCFQAAGYHCLHNCITEQQLSVLIKHLAGFAAAPEQLSDHSAFIGRRAPQLKKEKSGRIEVVRFCTSFYGEKTG